MWVKVIHLCKGSKRKYSRVGDYCKIILKKYKSTCFLPKKRKFISILTRLSYKSKRNDGSMVYQLKNECILYKRKSTFYSKHLSKVADKNVNRRRVLAKFAVII